MDPLLLSSSSSVPKRPCPVDTLLAGSSRVPSDPAAMDRLLEDFLSLSDPTTHQAHQALWILGAVIHPPPPTKPSSCQAVDLSPCRVFASRSTTNPSAMCCRQFKFAVRSSHPARCLCRSLDKDEALSISHACKLMTPKAYIPLSPLK